MGEISVIIQFHQQAQEWKGEYSGGCSFMKVCITFCLEAKVLGFHSIQELYKEDPDFKELFQGISNDNPYTIHEGYLFKSNKLCILRSPLRELLVREAHRGAPAGCFVLNKTIDILQEHFYQPNMEANVHKVKS